MERRANKASGGARPVIDAMQTSERRRAGQTNTAAAW